MTISVSFATVADSISKLSITGITVKDIDAIRDGAQLLCPILFPQPNNFVSDVNFERMTFGGGGTAKMDLTYTLNYVFLQGEAGAGISAFSMYSSIISNLAVILVAIFGNDNLTGAVDMQLAGIPEIGVIADPSDMEYWGALFALRVQEHVQ